MGNMMCPMDAEYGGTPLSCVMPCPDGFERRAENGAQRCISKIDGNVGVLLNPLPMVNRGEIRAQFSIASLKDSDPQIYTQYKTEQTRFNRAITLAATNIDHKAKVDAAAAEVLAATKSGDPAAISTASDKYTLLTGDPDALSAKHVAEIGAAADRFISDYRFLDTQAKQQQNTLDLIESVKDKLLTVKDDMEYSVGTFDKQITGIRNQININKKTRQQATDYGKWIDIGLNVAVVFALLFMVVVIGRKVMGVSGVTTTSSGPLGAPARPAASEHTIDLLKGLTGLLSASGTPAK